MRYQTWGISRGRLIAFALFPVAAWAALRIQSLPELSLSAIFLYYRLAIWIWGSVLLLLSLVWIYFFRRGIFETRWIAYLFMALELFFELNQSVQARDLLHLSSALVYFGLVLASYRLLESFVEQAAFNPKMHWYEGLPKSLPHLQLQVRSGQGDAPWRDAFVRRLDQQGLFIVMKEPVQDSDGFKPLRRLEFKLTWKQRTVLGEGIIVGKLHDDCATQQLSGIGLLFSPKGLYPFTQYTALFQALKGEGYAY